MLQMKTDRSMIKVILLSIVTCGIYGLIFYASIGDDMNLLATPRDGKKTMSYWLLIFLIAPLTCSIGAIVWFHKLSERIGEEARARGIYTNFGAGTYWLWNVLGSLIIVGPFIYLHQLCTTMNAICENQNAKNQQI
jgi:hypothetical protein